MSDNYDKLKADYDRLQAQQDKAKHAALKAENERLREVLKEILWWGLAESHDPENDAFVDKLRQRAWACLKKTGGERK